MPLRLFVIVVSRISLMVGGFRSEAIVGVIRGRKLFPQRSTWVPIGCFICLIAGIKPQESLFHSSTDIIRVKPYVNSLFNSTRKPVRFSVTKLNLAPEKIMPGLISVYRNG